MEKIYEAALDALQIGEIACVATIVQAQGSTPRGVGAKMMIHADGSIMGTIGGGEMEAKVIQDAQEAIAQGESRLVHYSLTGHGADSLSICGGEADIFLEILTLSQQLVIVGGGHIALSLAAFGPLLGFRTMVIDDREEFANPTRFPAADRTIVALPAKVPQVIDITPETFIVIVTRGHEYDAEALEAVIHSEARYIGLVGSRRKVRTILSQLQDKGISREALARVYTPIGLDIGSETPAEIALSIMAEILWAQRGGTGRPLREQSNPLWIQKDENDRNE